MVGADCSWNETILVRRRPHPAHRMADPWKAKPTGAEERFVGGDGADLPAIGAGEAEEPRPKVAAR